MEFNSDGNIELDHVFDCKNNGDQSIKYDPLNKLYDITCPRRMPLPATNGNNKTNSFVRFSPIAQWIDVDSVISCNIHFERNRLTHDLIMLDTSIMIIDDTINNLMSFEVGYILLTKSEDFDDMNNKGCFVPVVQIKKIIKKNNGIFTLKLDGIDIFKYIQEASFSFHEDPVIESMDESINNSSDRRRMFSIGLSTGFVPIDEEVTVSGTLDKGKFHLTGTGTFDITGSARFGISFGMDFDLDIKWCWIFPCGIDYFVFAISGGIDIDLDILTEFTGSIQVSHDIAEKEDEGRAFFIWFIPVWYAPRLEFGEYLELSAAYSILTHHFEIHFNPRYRVGIEYDNGWRAIEEFDNGYKTPISDFIFGAGNGNDSCSKIGATVSIGLELKLGVTLYKSVYIYLFLIPALKAEIEIPGYCGDGDICTAAPQYKPNYIQIDPSIVFSLGVGWEIICNGLTKLMNACGIGEEYTVIDELTLFQFPQICINNPIQITLQSCCELAASKTDQDVGTLRLSGTDSTEYQGLVEVVGETEENNYNWWTTVCNDNNQNVGQVICRELGHETDGVIVYNKENTETWGMTPYGEGKGYIGYWKVTCNGDEERFIYCQRDNGTPNCQHSEDISVKCPSPEKGTVRLYGDGATEYEGRVEIFNGKQWGTVCNQGINDKVGSVICRKLGLYPQGFTFYDAADNYGQGTGNVDIILGNIECIGIENDLFDCVYDTIHGCRHSDDVGIKCISYPDGTPRLTGQGSTDYEGRVEIAMNGIYGNLCITDLTPTEQNNVAKVICREIGASTSGYTLYFYANTFPYGYGLGPTIMKNPRCDGTEERVIHCNFTTDAEHCDDKQTSIKCKPMDGSIRLIGTESGYFEGRVEVYKNNGWGTICNIGIDLNVGAIICKQLGYTTDGFILYSTTNEQPYGEGTGNILLSNVDCDGTELNINDCSYTLDNNNCNHNQDISIKCLLADIGDVRLSEGTEKYEGRIEVFDGIKWGTICNKGIVDNNNNIGKVICGQLEYNITDGYILYNMEPTSSPTPFPEGPFPMLMSDIICNGDEAGLFDCSYTSDIPQSDNCDHSKQLGILCWPHVPVKGGDGFIQFDTFRIGIVDNNTLSISSKNNEKTNVYFKNDGSIHNQPADGDIYGLWDKDLLNTPINVQFTSNGIEFGEYWCLGQRAHGHLSVTHNNNNGDGNHKTALYRWDGAVRELKTDYSCWSNNFDNLLIFAADKSYIEFNGEFRIGYSGINSNQQHHLTVAGVWTIAIYRDDGQASYGPRDDWSWNDFYPGYDSYDEQDGKRWYAALTLGDNDEYDIDIGQDKFNQLFTISGVIKRECDQCSDDMKIVYYRRIYPYHDLSTFDAYNMMKKWQDSDDNILNTNYILTNDVNTAISNDYDYDALNANYWQYCNYNNFPDIPQIYKFGFRTGGGQHDGSGEVTLTLIYESEIYKCTISGSQGGYNEYYCYGYESLVDVNCINHNQILIETPSGSGDALKIDRIYVDPPENYNMVTFTTSICVSGDNDCGADRDTNHVLMDLSGSITDADLDYDSELNPIDCHVGKIKSFGIKTVNDESAGSAEAKLTLIYESEAYECTIYPASKDTTYLCDASLSFIDTYTECTGNNQIMIENLPATTDDALEVNTIYIIPQQGNTITLSIDPIICLAATDDGSSWANHVIINIDSSNDIDYGTQLNVESLCAFNPDGSNSAKLYKFGFRTINHEHGGSAEARLTLIYESEAYECTIYPTNGNTEYYCDGSTTLVDTNCRENNQMLIENWPLTTGDRLQIDRIYIDPPGNFNMMTFTTSICLAADGDCPTLTNHVIVDISDNSNDPNLDYDSELNVYSDCRVGAFGQCASNYGANDGLQMYCDPDISSSCKSVKFSILLYHAFVPPTGADSENNCDVMAAASYLEPGDRLLMNEYITSGNGKYTAKMQYDGNFVIYRENVGAIWATNTVGTLYTANIVFQGDNNLVIYRENVGAIWASNTNHHQTGSNARVEMRDDGDLCLYDNIRETLWCSNTAQASTVISIPSYDINQLSWVWIIIGGLLIILLSFNIYLICHRIRGKKKNGYLSVKRVDSEYSDYSDSQNNT